MGMECAFYLMYAKEMPNEDFMSTTFLLPMAWKDRIEEKNPGKDQ